MKNSTYQSSHFQHVLCFFRSISKYILTLAVAFSFHVIYTQSLDDFKRSAGYSRGVEIIPFSSLRSSASSIADNVQRLKEEYSTASTLTSFTASKKKLLGTIAGNTKKLNATKALQADFPDVVVDDWVRDIDEANRAIDQANTELNSINDKMKEVVNKLDKLMDARRDLYKKFEEVLSELKNAKSNPSRYIGDNPSEDDIRSLNGYIDDITENIEDENEAHMQAIKEEENAKKNLEEIIGKTEYWK
jgi:uncharacterized phage infection (PIP) family protein YhgE